MGGMIKAWSLIIAISINLTPISTTIIHVKPPIFRSQNQRSAIQLRRIGRGTVDVIQWASINQGIMVGGSQGVWLYSSELNDIKYFEDEVEPISTFSISPDGTRVASNIKYQSQIQIRDISKGTIVATITHSSEVQNLAWSPDGLSLASAGRAGDIRIWDANSYKVMLEFKGHEAPITSLSWSPDSRELASASSDKTVRIWQVPDGKSLARLDAHSEDVTQVVWSPDGHKLASVGPSQGKTTVTVWDMATYRPIWAHDNLTYNGMVAWRPNRNVIVGETEDGKMRTWNGDNGNELSASPMEMWVNIFAWSPDGTRLVTVNNDQTIETRNAESFQVIKQRKDHSPPVDIVRWRIGTNQIAVAYRERTDISIFDAQTGLLQQTLITPSPVAASLGVSALAWSPDGKFLAVAFQDNAVNIWAFKGNHVDKPLVLQLNTAQPFISWNSDNRTLLIVGGLDLARRVSIWDTTNGKQLSVLDTKQSSIEIALYSPDGKSMLLSFQDYDLQIWDAKTYKQTAEFPGRLAPLDLLSWSPNNKLVAGIDCQPTSGECEIWNWNLSSSQVSTPFKGLILGRSQSLEWSPDGSKLAADDGYRTVYILDVSGNLLSTLSGNVEALNSISWNSHSNLLATASEDGSVRLWEISAAL